MAIALICGATIIGGMAIHGGTERTESAGKDNVDLRAYEDSRWLAYAQALSVSDVPNQPVVGQEAIEEPIIDAPTPATPDLVSSPVYPAGARGDLAALVGAAFPEDPRMANHVVWAESIGDWNKNWECTVYGGCWSVTSDCGLLQVNVVHAGKFAAHGWDINVDCFVPERNLVIAREVFDAQGCRAWSACR